MINGVITVTKCLQMTVIVILREVIRRNKPLVIFVNYLSESSKLSKKYYIT